MTISGHPDQSYNGVYRRADSSKQKELLNGCPWYQKTAPDGSVRVLFYYNQNSGGAKSWNLDSGMATELWDGRSDWCEGGWIGPETYPNPPLPQGTKKWSGTACGMLTLDFAEHTGGQHSK